MGRFPNALAEVLRQGLPAVGLSTTAGVNELLIHKKNGLLTSPNEVILPLVYRK